MRKWYVPLGLLGLGGLGLLFATQRGRETVKRLANFVDAAPDAWREWNEAAMREIARLQSAVDELAQNLGTAQ